MSDLLKRLRDQRKERFETQVETGECIEAEKPTCEPGYIPECITTPYGKSWRCVVDRDYVEPTEPIPTETGGVAPLLPEVVAGQKFPNVGTPVSDITGGRVSIQNLFRVRVQMGDEYGPAKGWYKVIFPQSVIGARVIATSGPRSAKVSADTLKFDRRSNYIDAFSTGVGDAIAIWLKVFVPNIWPLHEVINGIIDPMATELSKIYGSFIYDFVIKPQMDITKDLVGATFGKLTDSWGIERGRSVHNVDIKNITNESFEWYAYGEHYINWVAIGTLPADEDPALPPEITQPIDDIKTRIDEIQAQYDEQLQAMRTQIQDIFIKLGIEPPPSPIFPRLGQQ